MNPNDGWVIVEEEIAKVRGFFEGLPEELRADAAHQLIQEIVIWGGRDHFQMVGILVESLFAFRQLAQEEGGIL